MPREAGCILILARNEDEQGLKSSLESFEQMVSLEMFFSGTKGRTDCGILSCSSTPSSSILTFCWCVALSPAQSLKSDSDSLATKVRHALQARFPSLAQGVSPSRRRIRVGSGHARARLGHARLDGQERRSTGHGRPGGGWNPIRRDGVVPQHVPILQRTVCDASSAGKVSSTPTLCP